jgi:hypothetical protein
VPRARRPAEEPEPEEGAESSPPPGSPDSSEGSSASEAGFEQLLAEPGPEFDADQAGEDASARDGDRLLTAAPGGEAGIVIEWDEQTIRSLLEAQGSAVHGLIGKAEEDWVYTRTELAAIAKPLTRILNRYDATRVAASTGDEIALILGLAGYTMRSVQERKAVLAAQKALEEQDQPAGGIPVPPIPEEPLI